MNKDQPKIFIGSSGEGLKIAYGIQENLEHDALCQVWSQGIFELTGNALDNLLEATTNFDFAIFVFQPDDLVKIRDSQYRVVRDNLIFELGLFISKLGKEKVFFLVPRNEKDLHLPTDLLGIQPGHYDHPCDEVNLLGSLGPFCNKVRRQMNKQNSVNKSSVYSEINEELDRSPKSENLTKVKDTINNVSNDIEDGVTEDNFGNYTISIQPTVFFHHRICSSFPGVRELQWFQDPQEALDRLELLLKKPLFFEKSVGHGTTCDPLWWFRPLRALYVKRFRRINETRCLLNYDELEVEKIAVFRSNAYWQSFVYVQTKADVPIGIYSYAPEDFKRMKNNFGYAYEEYGLFEDIPITRECFDDGAAVIDGKVTDTFGAELRGRYLSKYNFIISSKFSLLSENFDFSKFFLLSFSFF